MPSQISIMARVRKLLEAIDSSSADTPQQVTVNDQLEFLVANAAAQYAEIIRTGRAFEVHTTAAIAAVVAIPTTAAMLSIWNGEVAGGKSLIIDRVWGLRIASTTAIASQASLIGCLGQTAVASLGAASGLTRNALNSNAGTDSKSVSYLNAVALDAVTGVAANWRVLPGQTGGLKISTGAATVGGDFINSDVNGRVIVAPGHVFAVHVFAPLVAETFTCGIEWHEKVLRLG